MKLILVYSPVFRLASTCYKVQRNFFRFWPRKLVQQCVDLYVDLSFLRLSQTIGFHVGWEILNLQNKKNLGLLNKRKVNYCSKLVRTDFSLNRLFFSSTTKVVKTYRPLWLHANLVQSLVQLIDLLRANGHFSWPQLMLFNMAFKANGSVSSSTTLL